MAREALALFDWIGEDSSELSFRKNDLIVNVEACEEEGWFRGKLSRNGESGLFPGNYVEFKKPSINANAPGARNTYDNNYQSNNTSDYRNNSYDKPDEGSGKINKHATRIALMEKSSQIVKERIEAQNKLKNRSSSSSDNNNIPQRPPYREPEPEVEQPGFGPDGKPIVSKRPPMLQSNQTYTPPPPSARNRDNNVASLTKNFGSLSTEKRAGPERPTKPSSLSSSIPYNTPEFVEAGLLNADRPLKPSELKALSSRNSGVEPPLIKSFNGTPPSFNSSASSTSFSRSNSQDNLDPPPSAGRPLTGRKPAPPPPIKNRDLSTSRSVVTESAPPLPTRSRNASDVPNRPITPPVVPPPVLPSRPIPRNVDVDSAPPPLPSRVRSSDAVPDRPAGHQGKPIQSLTEIPLDQQLQYEKVYAQEHTTSDKSRMKGDQVRAIWLRSGLDNPALGKVWALVDAGRDGWLSKREFVVGMWLIDERLKGFAFPDQLPVELFY